MGWWSKGPGKDRRSLSWRCVLRVGRADRLRDAGAGLVGLGGRARADQRECARLAVGAAAADRVEVADAQCAEPAFHCEQVGRCDARAAGDRVDVDHVEVVGTLDQAQDGRAVDQLGLAAVDAQHDHAGPAVELLVGLLLGARHPGFVGGVDLDVGLRGRGRLGDFAQLQAGALARGGRDQVDVLGDQHARFGSGFLEDRLVLERRGLGGERCGGEREARHQTQGFFHWLSPEVDFGTYPLPPFPGWGQAS